MPDGLLINNFIWRNRVKANNDALVSTTERLIILFGNSIFTNGIGAIPNTIEDTIIKM